MTLYEQELLDFHQYNLIAGVDEAGRGPLAGPVAAAAVILKKTVILAELNDSKKVSEKKRDYLFDKIIESSLAYEIVLIDANTIDEINILQASLLAMQKAVSALPLNPELCLIDGNKIPVNIGCSAQAVVKGDGTYASIAAASILAKVTRDRFMIRLHDKYPQYNFKKNKGYPTKAHIEAIQKYGICPFHRKSFKPVMEYVFDFRNEKDV